MVGGESPVAGEGPVRPEPSVADAIPVLLGPTATGKTELLLRLPFIDRVEVISCDSRQVYRGMPIGTAQPDAETVAVVSHHLVGFLDPSSAYSAGEFRRDVDRLVPEIRARGKVPLVVGGTGFYFRALSTEMIEIPEDPGLRADLEALSHEERLALLREKDAGSLATNGETPARGKVHPNDRYRVLRSLMVLLQTGRPLRSYYEEGFRQRADRRFAGIWLDLPAGEWKERIAGRALQMIEMGLVDEAGRVREQYGDCPALRTPGYAEALDLLAGRISLPQMREKLIRSHLQYGRRQRVWLRREPLLACVGDADEAVARLGKIAGGRIRD